MMNFERYTKYNYFELTIAILRRVCAPWQAKLNLAKKWLKLTKNVPKY